MTNNKNTGKLLYVQLSRDETRLTLLGGPEAPSLVLPTPAGAMGDGMIQNLDAMCALLKPAVQQEEFKSCRKVVFSLCTSQVITEVAADVPANVSGKNLEKLLVANADKYFPVVDMQEYKLVWQTIGPKGGDSKEQMVQLWAVPMAMLKRYYQLANACNLMVERIDYCGSSIAAAVGASFSKPGKGKERVKLNLNMELSFGKKKGPEEAGSKEAAAEQAEPVKHQPDTQLYVFMENDLLGITFVQQTQVKLQRFIRCGANPVHQFDELAMMVEYYRSMEAGRGSAITGFVCGGLADNQAMVAELASTLGISMQLWDQGYEPKWVLCVGAAAGKLEFGMPALNVMKAGRQVEKQLWQYILLLATGLVLVAAVLMLMTARLSWQEEKNQLESQRQTLIVQMQQSNGFADNYNKYNSEYNNYSSDWDTIMNSLHTYNDSLVVALEELEATMPENTSVTSLQIASDGMTVSFSCSSKEEAAYLIIALRQMEYMDLVYISNLTGGGGGPVDSYGPVDKETDDGTEAPPTEGDYGDLSDAEIALLASLLEANIDQDELMTVFLGLSDSEMERLENVYGKKPSNHYSSLSMLRSAYATKNIFAQRCEALKQMLSTNPFVLREFPDMVMADMFAADPILFWYIYEELTLPENDDLLNMLTGSGALTDAEQAYEMLDRMLKILTKDEETLTATEDLLCTDSKMQRWYVYYLEMELGLQEKTALGFLNMDRLLADLMEGSFDTGDRNLDKKLNALVPDEVWAALEQIKNMGGGDIPLPTDPAPDDYSNAVLLGLLAQYVQNGTTDDEYINTLIENFLTTGSTGDAQWDAWLEPYKQYLNQGGSGGDLPNPLPGDGKKPSDFQQSELLSMAYQYAATGSTGNDYIDGLISNYILTGSTGDADWDAWLEPLKNILGIGGSGGSGGEDTPSDPNPEDYSRAELLKNLYQYIQNGKCDDAYINKMIKNYLANGTTGNDAWDAWLAPYEKYLKKENGGELPNPVPDDGKKPNDYASGDLMTMLFQYLNSGSTGDTYLDGLIDNFLLTGSTGDDDWDAWLEPYKIYLLGGNNGGGSSSSGSSGNYPYYITVSLKYTEALLEAVQDRDVLNAGEKIEKVEVTG